MAKRDKRRSNTQHQPVRGTLSEQASSLRGASGRTHTPHSRAARTQQAKQNPRSRQTAFSQSVPTPQRKAEQKRTLGSKAAQKRTPASKAPQKPRPALTPKQLEARKKRNAFIRKGIIWLLIAGIVVAGIAFAGSTIRNSIDAIDAATSEPDPVDSYREIACTPELITSQLSADVTYAGKPVDFTVTLSNQEKKRACYLDAGYSQVNLNVMSGDELIWDSQECAFGDESMQLLIGAQRQGTLSVQWDGKVAGEGCQGTALSQPGTYRAQLYWKGEKLGTEYVFELQQEPAPEPPPAEGTAEGSAEGAAETHDGAGASTTE